MKRFVLFALFAASALFLRASEPLKIAVVADVHFLSDKLADESSGAYLAYRETTGRDLAVLHRVLDTVLYDLKTDKVDVLLIPGDLTNHGERQSHLDFIEKLKPLQQNGTRIFVVPGNHDIHIPDAKAYLGEKTQSVETVSAKEFEQLYASFGYGNALKKDTASLSYLAEIDKETWLLCFDTNRYAEHIATSISGGRILPQTLAWALDILREAEEKNIAVLGMMHHGLVEHLPYQSSFFANYLVTDWQKNAEILADAGLKVIFTGHFHANDISAFVSPAGNTVMDVETASLVQYPFAYRVMELGNSGLSIDTRFITAIDGEPDLETVYRKKSETVARRVVRNRLTSLEMSLPETMLDALTGVIVRMSLLHMHGDENPDEEMKNAVRNFAQLLGCDEADSDFQFDFPPADNQLVIELR